ncbi:hypothetical protein [Occallatibacter savannae]|uniref:hypothetical protein n=1 Tax=Occallatibacter savannae TaxID=1002691 RepID=UPI000D695CDF|nr:hypothetical protein [Occallatibacter savannae]
MTVGRELRRLHTAGAIAIGFLPILGLCASRAQQPDPSAIIRDLDAANISRHNNVLEYSNIERYVVYRGEDQTHPAAEMTVRVTYKKGAGKSYTVLKQSGSAVVLKFGLYPLLENEKAINDPSRVAQSWFTTANYDMQLKPGVTRVIDGRNCVAVAIAPHRKAPNMVEGTLWVDARDHTLVEVDGVASKKPSVFAGRTSMMRRYVKMTGYAMATHAHAESSSFLFGRTAVNIDYSDYQFQLQH